MSHLQQPFGVESGHLLLIGQLQFYNQPVGGSLHRTFERLVLDPSPGSPPHLLPPSPQRLWAQVQRYAPPSTATATGYIYQQSLYEAHPVHLPSLTAI